MKSYFYPKSFYTSIVAFADIFNDMTIRVYDSTTDQIIGIKPVPVTLSPKEKIVQILKSQNGVNDVDPQIDNYLPRISIYMTGFNRNPERSRGKNEKRLINIEYDEEERTRTLQTDIQGVAYDLQFEVTIWAKYQIDGMQIIENILPWFDPEIHVSVKERNFGIEKKCKVTLDSVSQNHVYEYGEKERRILQWNLSFTMESMVWKPMELSKEITCAKITFNSVPCEKIPFQGEKINIYEPVSESNLSLFDKSVKVRISDLDKSEQYDAMVDHWKKLNRVLDAPNYLKCVEDHCATPLGPRPEWAEEYDVSSCIPLIKKPCVTCDRESGEITNYWQEMVLDTTNRIRIVSYQRIYDSNGTTISGPDVIDNDEYPDCYPEETITPSPSGGVVPEPEPELPPDPEPELPPEDCGYTTTG